MCESLGFLNLTAQLKQRTSLCLRNDPLWGAIPALPFDLVSGGAARAYTLGPERW